MKVMMPTRSEVRTAVRILAGLGLDVDPVKAWRELRWLRERVRSSPASVSVPLSASGRRRPKGAGGFRGGVAFDDRGRPAGMVLETVDVCPNRLEVLTCGDLDATELIPTADRSDRAHGRTDVFDGHREWGGRHVPAKDVPTSRPRRYPRCHLTSRGCAFDRAFDESFQRVRRLSRLVGEVDGITCSRPMCERVAEVDLAAAKNEIRLRDIVEGDRIAWDLPTNDAAACWLREHQASP